MACVRSTVMRGVFVGCLLLGGCYNTYLARPGSLPPAVATVPAEQRVAVWQHAIAALLDQGYVPQVLNEAACFVSAKLRDDLATDTTRGALAVVVVAPDGTVRVQASGVGFYQSQEALEADLRKRQDLILRATLATAPAR